MVVAVGAPRPRFGAHLWLPPLKGHSAAAGGVAGGGDGKHARWCHARPAHSARALLGVFLERERRAGVSCGPYLHLVPLS